MPAPTAAPSTIAVQRRMTPDASSFFSRSCTAAVDKPDLAGDLGLRQRRVALDVLEDLAVPIVDRRP